MRDRTNHTETQIARASDKILGTKFCFACQRKRPLDAGRMVTRGKTKTWRCLECINKKNPVGFK